VIEKWLVAIRDHPNRPPALQQLVLDRLALRMDWYTGRGFASTQMLMDDASAGEHTVRRATKWARQAELLLRTRRGHYIGGETEKIASEWLLTQPATGDLLGSTQPANGSDPTGQSAPPNRAAQMHHQESSTSSTSPSALSARPSAQRAKRRARARRADAPSPRRAQPQQPSRTVDEIIAATGDDPWARDPLYQERAAGPVDHAAVIEDIRRNLAGQKPAPPSRDEAEAERQRQLAAIDEWERQNERQEDTP
jgi:hypothetical protein